MTGSVGLLTVDGHRLLQEALGGRKVTVTLDGEPVDGCFVADWRYGYVGVYKLDADGRRYVDKARGEPATEILTGKVRYEVTA